MGQLWDKWDNYPRIFSGFFPKMSEMFCNVQIFKFMKLKILFIVYDPCPLNYRTMEGYYGTKKIVNLVTSKNEASFRILGL